MPSISTASLSVYRFYSPVNSIEVVQDATQSTRDVITILEFSVNQCCQSISMILEIFFRTRLGVRSSGPISIRKDSSGILPNCRNSYPDTAHRWGFQKKNRQFPSGSGNGIILGGPLLSHSSFWITTVLSTNRDLLWKRLIAIMFTCIWNSFRIFLQTAEILPCWSHVHICNTSPSEASITG